MPKEEGVQFPAEERGEVPPFENFLPVVSAQEWRRIKGEVFDLEGREVREQPHGIDLAVHEIIAVDPETNLPERPVRWNKSAEGGEIIATVELRSGGSYIALLRPLLQAGIYERLPFDIEQFPKSSLLRAGIKAGPSSFTRTFTSRQADELRRLSLPYRDNREAAFFFSVANKNGVLVEKDTPFVQIALFRKPEDPQNRITVEQQLFWHEHRRADDLTLGRVLEFGGVQPRIAREESRHLVEVAVELPEREGKYRLKTGQPYLIETSENLVFSAHERGFTWIALPGVEGYGGALVDAGYRGKFIYLVIPHEDLVLRKGDKIAKIERQNVPTTSVLYSGHFGERR